MGWVRDFFVSVLVDLGYGLMGAWFLEGLFPCASVSARLLGCLAMMLIMRRVAGEKR
jgi:hypothetical protein